MTFEITEAEKQELMKEATPANRAWIEERAQKPVLWITCSYRFKKKSAKYPDQIFIYYLGDTDSRWMAKVRSLPLIAERAGTRDECIDEHFRYRQKFSIYDNWEDLIADEQLLGIRQEFIDELIAGSMKYPITKKKDE